MTTMTFKPGQLYHLPPGDLLLERNIRDAKPDDGLIDSIRSVGVLEPITAVVTDAGAPLVRQGHRRTLAAIAADQATVPVYIRGADNLSDEAEVARIIAQHDENTHRAALTAAEEIGVVEQFVAFGLTAEEMTAQARLSEESVTTALKVSGSKLAKKSAAKYSNLTLDHVAAVAEFDDDPEAATALVVCAIEKPDTFRHTLQRARDDRAEAQKRAVLEAEIEAAGAKVVKRPTYYEKTAVELRRLRVKVGGKILTLEDHKSCPGHVGWIDYGNTVEYGCDAHKKHGHHDAAASSKPTAAELSPAEREKAAAARKLVVENNKAWPSAEKVRRAWLADFIQTKTAPKGAAAFIAIALTRDRGQFAQYDTTPGELVASWLRVKKPSGGWDLTPHVEKATEGRALVLALVQVLANYEAHMTKDSWRGDGTTNAAGRYLRFLESCGYGLSDVEKFAISKKTA